MKKKSNYIFMAFFFSTVALIDSSFDPSFMLAMRVVVICVAVALFYSMFVTKKWYLGLGILVDERRGKNLNLIFLKYPVALIYVSAIVISAAGGWLLGLKNTF